MAAAMQHASTIDLSKSLFIRVLYAMPRMGEAPPGATVTFLPRGKAGAPAGRATKPYTRDKAHWCAPAAPAMMQSYRATTNRRAAS